MIRGMRRILLVVVVLALAACASARVKEQRTSQGPMAEDLWMTSVILANGRIILDAPRGTLGGDEIHRLYALHTEEVS